MKAFLVVALMFIFSPDAFAESIVCPDTSFPRTVEDQIKIEKDSNNKQITYTVILPDTYSEEILDHAWLNVIGKDGTKIEVPLDSDKTEVSDWSKSHVAFVHTQSNSLGLTVNASYGFPCTWHLVATLRAP